MDKIKVMGFHQPPLSFSLIIPIPKRHPQISPHIQQKIHKGCRNNYLEACGAVYWAKKAALKSLRGLQQAPFGGRGINARFGKKIHDASKQRSYHRHRHD